MMLMQIPKTIDEYFETANETTEELLASTSSLMTAIRTYYSVLGTRLFVRENAMSPMQAPLAMHGFLMYVSAIRVALSGNPAATFPVLRAALESSCYAFLMGEEPALGTLWLERDKGEDVRRACRRRFASAVKDAAQKIQAKDRVVAGTEEWINDLYDASIDFGGHPNPKAILPYIQLENQRPDGRVGMALGGLYGSTSFETERTLVACLDYGWAVALMLVFSSKDVKNEDVLALIELNDLKEEVVSEHFPVGSQVDR